MFKNLFLNGLRCQLSLTVRSYAVSVDKASLGELRKRTGISFINCKKALEKFDNDVDQAEQWLKEEAVKHGWAKATKLQGRSMSQGLLGMIQNSNSATVVEVNCETDFVAKNKDFHELVNKITSAASHFFTQQTQQLQLSATELAAIKSGEITIADMVALGIGNIGENITARRAVHMTTNDGGFIGAYMHVSGEDLKAGDCSLGKFVAMAEFQNSDPSNTSEDLNNHSTNICRHIVGMNPRTLGEYNPDNIRDLESESSQSESESSSSDEEDNKSKNEQQEEKNTEEGGEDDEDVEEVYLAPKIRKDDGSLLNQDYLLNPEYVVGEYLDMHGLKLTRFIRWECGEVVPEELTEDNKDEEKWIKEDEEK